MRCRGGVFLCAGAARSSPARARAPARSCNGIFPTQLQLIFLLILSLLTGAPRSVLGGSIVIQNGTFPAVRDVPALFGAHIPPEGLTGYLKAASPLSGCTPLTNPPYPEPWIALLERSLPSDQCGFVTKVRNAERAGAAAAIVFDYIDGPMIPMAKRSDQPDVSIPAVFISLAGSRMLRTIMVGRCTGSPWVLAVDPTLACRHFQGLSGAFSS